MMRNFAILGVVAMMAAGCGNVGKKNVEACDDWLASMACGDTDFSGLIDCGVYEETTCDVSDYFTCLSDNTTCDEDAGIADTTGWADCVSKASCE